MNKTISIKDIGERPNKKYWVDIRDCSLLTQDYIGPALICWTFPGNEHSKPMIRAILPLDIYEDGCGDSIEGTYVEGKNIRSITEL